MLEIIAGRITITEKALRAIRERPLTAQQIGIRISETRRAANWALLNLQYQEHSRALRIPGTMQYEITPAGKEWLDMLDEERRIFLDKKTPAR